MADPDTPYEDCASGAAEQEAGACLDQLRLVGAAAPAAALEEQLRADAAALEADAAVLRREILAGRPAAPRGSPEAGAAGGAEAPAEELSPEEERELHQELRRRHQVDLNDERHLAELEDKGLAGHMESARSELASQELKRQALPRLDAVCAQHVKNKQQASHLVRTLQAAGLEAQCGVEDAFLQASNAGKLAAGHAVHGGREPLTAVAGYQSALKTLGGKTEEAARAFQAAAAAMAATVNGLDVLRRDQEVVVDGLTALLRHYQASHDALARLLGK